MVMIGRLVVVVFNTPSVSSTFPRYSDRIPNQIGSEQTAFGAWKARAAGGAVFVVVLGIVVVV